jgi:hypothetical protein
MLPQPSRATITMGILLAVAWTALAYGLGAILSGLLREPDPASASSAGRDPGSISVKATGTDPCTGKLVNVEARLTIKMIQDGETGGTSADADVRLENFPGTSPSEGIRPAIRHLSIFKTPLSSKPFVTTVRTPLAGRLSYVELVVELVGGVTDRGEVSLSLASARIEAQPLPCGSSPPGAP